MSPERSQAPRQVVTAAADNHDGFGRLIRPFPLGCSKAFPRLMNGERIFVDRSETQTLSAAMFSWLVESGISPLAMAQPAAIAATRGIFDERDRYAPNRLGDNLIVLPIVDGGILDAAAYDPRGRRIATRLGLGACLGQGQIGRMVWALTGRPCLYGVTHWDG